MPVKSQPQEVRIAAGPGIELGGTLTIPPDARGIVIFAHGSGSSRRSPRNRFVADVLNDGGFATLLMDLLTEEEARNRANVFDIALLAERLRGASVWSKREPTTADLAQGYFGASTGAAAALVAAADQPDIRAIVSRGGRPDMAGDWLPRVAAPTLLIVGGLDNIVIDLNRQALNRLICRKKLVVVPGATHLFEEPGTLEQVADLAREWFDEHLVSATAR